MSDNLPSHAPAWETDPANLPVIVVSIVMAAVCVGIHFAFIRALILWMVRRGGVRTQWPILISVLVLLTSHLVQIFVFAGAYAGLQAVFGESIGALEGDYEGYRDLAYFSGIVYTTVGFGDIVPVGPERLLVATEALVGLVLVAWSASFSFLLMHTYAKERFDVDAPDLHNADQ